MLLCLAKVGKRKADGDKELYEIVAEARHGTASERIPVTVVFLVRDFQTRENKM